jgi:hypothetical protein
LRRIDPLARVCAVVIALLALASNPGAAQAPRATQHVQRIEVASQLIETFDPREPGRRRFGALNFRGGLVLASSHPQFGGLSALRIAASGERFLSLTDRGYWLRGRIVYRGDRPVAIADAEMAPVLGPDGRPLRRRGWYDTEALAEDNGVLYVGIERVNEILRFDYGKHGLLAPGVPIAVPAGIKTLPHNKGIECLVMAPAGGPLAGTLIAVSEQGLDVRGNLRGFLIGKSGGAFALRRTEEFDVTDCAVTPDGEFLVLERRFSWAHGAAMRIRSMPLADIKPGALVDGRELIVADMAAQIDNMEGLAMHRAADGALVLTIVSDDNFSPLQRTVLLQFTWVGQ